MSPIRHFATLTAMMCGTSAHADVSAQQVWDHWSDRMTAFNNEFVPNGVPSPGDGFTTGAQVMSGDTLTVSDVRLNMKDDGGHFTTVIGDVKLMEVGDGTVRITLEPTLDVVIKMTPDNGDQTDISFSVTHDNMDLIASGDPDAINYAISADRLAMTLDGAGLTAEDDVEFSEVEVELKDVAGAYTLASNALDRRDYSWDMGAFDITMVASNPKNSDAITLKSSLTDLAIAAGLTLPLDLDMDTEFPPFDDGLAFDATYSFGAATYSFDADLDGVVATGTAKAENGTMELAVDFDSLIFTGQSNNLELMTSPPEGLPVPIELTLGGYGFDFQIPLSQDDDGGTRDAVVAFDVTDLSISDAIWNLGDPAGILARGPMTIALDLQAKVTPFFDFLDPNQHEAIALADVPGEISRIEITDLAIRGLGTDISGDADFTFNNADLQTFPGFPRPQGEANFAINGMNALIDRLIEMGLIPQDEAMMPRLMMGMVTVPVGDDELTSTVEINEEGHIYANGQRLR